METQKDQKITQKFGGSKDKLFVLDLTPYFEAEKIVFSLTNKNKTGSEKGQFGRFYLEIEEARRIYEEILLNQFPERIVKTKEAKKDGQGNPMTQNGKRVYEEVKKKGVYVSLGGGHAKHREHKLEARVFTLSHQVGRDYPYTIRIENGVGKKPQGAKNDLVVMAHKDVDVYIQLTRWDTLEVFQSAIRAYDRWILRQEMLGDLAVLLHLNQPKTNPKTDIQESSYRLEDVQDDINEEAEPEPTISTTTSTTSSMNHSISEEPFPNLILNL